MGWFVIHACTALLDHFLESPENLIVQNWQFLVAVIQKACFIPGIIPRLSRVWELLSVLWSVHGRGFITVSAIANNTCCNSSRTMFIPHVTFVSTWLNTKSRLGLMRQGRLYSALPESKQCYICTRQEILSRNRVLSATGVVMAVQHGTTPLYTRWTVDRINHIYCFKICISSAVLCMNLL